MADSLNEKYRALLTLGPSMFENLEGIQDSFKRDHDTYCTWLLTRIGEICQESVKPLLRDLDLDWVTFHYRTRHVRQEWSRFGEWLQSGQALHGRMRKHESALQVSRGKAPYFSPVTQEAIEEGRPLRIVFSDDPSDAAQWSGNYLHVQGEIREFLAMVTRGRADQPLLEDDEIEMLAACDADTRDCLVNRIRQISDAEISEVEAFSWLRNVCRVTILALSFDDGRLSLPRVIVHIPVYLGDNLIGGGAYAGGGPGHFKDDSNALYISLLTQTLHGSLRIVEEEQRERSIRFLEELSRARAEFVQRVSHSLLGPIEELKSQLAELLSARSDEGIHAALEISDELYKAAGEIMLTFSKENVDDFLTLEKRSVKIGRFLSTIAFMNRNAYARRDIELSLGQVSDDWTFEIDTTSLTEVFMNLLSNALRYAKAKVWMSVSSCSVDGRPFWRIGVADDGNAMAPDVVPRLFRPDLYESLRHEGSSSHGFGLYLSRRVVEKHGGDLLYNVEERGFTEFVVTLPKANSKAS